MKIYTAILAGGVGTRLWPRSRQSHPKQFSDIIGTGQSMIQATVNRLKALVDEHDIFVVTGAEYTSLVAEQLTVLPTTNIIGEPEGRNTAPAIGLACLHLYAHDPNAVVAFLHADHVMLDEEAFRTTLKRAAAIAEMGYLVTLGIEPTSPHTGYGYIRRDQQIVEADNENLPVYAVKQFLEKPDRKTAEAFVVAGDTYWNGGIFVCQVRRMLAEIERQLPALYAQLAVIGPSIGTESYHDVMRSVWPEVPSVSIDHGIMESAENVAVVPLRAGWMDVGSWDALDGIVHPDDNDNLNVGSDLFTVESFNNIVYCGEKAVALIGVEDLVIVDAGDALLVGHRKQMQKVKDVVAQLRAEGRHDLL